MGVIQDLRDEKAIILFHDYRNNQAIDDAKNEHDMTRLDGVLTDTVWDGRGLTFPENTSVVDVIDDADLQLTAGCLVVFTNERIQAQPTGNEYLISKRDGGGTNYQWLATTAGMSFYDGANTRTRAATLTNLKTLAVNFTNGGTPEAFGDGVTLGSFSGTVAVSANDAPLEIGNYKDFIFVNFQSTLQAAMIINRVLTADEHADLHAELVARFDTERWDDAQERILSQFQDSTNVKKLIDVIFNRIDNIDYVLRYLRDYTGLNTACGVWLDVVGDIIGIPRPHIEQSYGTIFSFKPLVDPGTAWEIESSAADNDWWSTYSCDCGLYVAVGSSGTADRVMTSPDGINWTARDTTGKDNDWRGVACNDNIIAAVATSGTGNRAMSSPDGINWTLRTTPADNNWFSVCWSEDVGLFAAVAATGTGNRVMTSPDGITWTIRTSAADNKWRSVCWGNGLYVAVSSDGSGNRVMTSPNGITWTSRTSAANNEWYSVCWSEDAGLFVAVASTGTGDRVMTSTDGFNWYTRTSAADNNWRSVCAGDGILVATAITGSGDRVMISDNGIDWELQNSAADNQWRSVCFGGAQFISVADSGSGNRVMRSAKSMGIDDPYKGWV